MQMIVEREGKVNWKLTGKNLRKIRKFSGVTMQELAKEMRFGNFSSIAHIENGVGTKKHIGRYIAAIESIKEKRKDRE